MFDHHCIFLQEKTSLRSILQEKSQLELEMREIYDKRESVAQWEAQISEIIKWYDLPFISAENLTLWRPESHERLLLQTVKTQMKCRNMRHFIRVCTVFWDNFNLQRKNIVKIVTCDPTISIMMDHPDFIVCSFMENSIGLKRVNQHCISPGK